MRSLNPALLALVVISALFAGCASDSEARKSITDLERAQLLIEVANGALTEGDFTGALQMLAQAEPLDPRNPSVFHTRALALIGRGMYKEATAAARRSVELAPKYPEANATLGKLLLDAGDTAGAEKHLRVAADDILYRDSYKAQTSLAIIRYRDGRNAEARELLDRAIRNAPQAACAAYYYRGHLSLRENRVNDAIEDYDRASRKLCSRFADAHLALGIAFERGHQFGRARKKYLDITQNFATQPAAKQAMDRLRYLP